MSGRDNGAADDIGCAGGARPRRNRVNRMRVSTMAIVCALLVGAAQTGIAEEFGWRDSDGKLRPDSPTAKSSQGFAGMVLLTPDADWKAKWERPENPHFNQTETVKLGETVHLLILFANAQPDAKGVSRVLCGIQIVRPDGSMNVDEKDLECAKEKFEGPPYQMYLARVTPGFRGDPGDPPGTWSIRVHLTDAVRKVSVDLEQKFEYVKE